MKIAISVSDKEKAKGKDSSYFRAMLVAGASADELVTAGSPEHRAEDFDGIVLSGGEDVDPELYEQEKRYENVKVNRRRDDFELKLLDDAQASALPVFGICRGLQLINVKFGGTLHQDLKNDTEVEFEHRQKEGRDELTHIVTVSDSDSRLGAVLQGHCNVNSFHHQAIERVGRGLKVTARSEDDIVEAVEAADNSHYLVAVQWHPEEIAELPEQKRILQQFIEQCRKRAQQKGQSASATS
jgi:putative glutamine amidotransferase